MKRIFLILLLLMLTVVAQKKNRITTDAKTGKAMLIGVCDRTAFVDTNFAWWFNSGYKFYHPEKDVMDSLKTEGNNFSVTIVMGTWCSDSRREVPRFYKILDSIGYADSTLTLINVDRKKEGGATNIDSLNIKLIPTFIIYENGNEIGRITETPKTNLENDLLNILNKKNAKQ